MCRLFAQVSPAPAGARALLVDSPYSLLRQSDMSAENPQKDGWGVAWFGADGKPRVVKSGRPASDEADRFAAAADAAYSPVVLGHVRAASNPFVDDAHAHPFEDEGWAFAHNGTLTIHKEVAAALGPRQARLKTDSDTEVYFQQFLKHLAATGDPALAFEACVAEDWSLWAECRDRYPDATTPYTSLNAVAADARGAHAFCHASRVGLARFGLCHPDQPWSVMSWATRDGRFVVASEGVDGGEWTRLRPPETVSAVVEGGELKVTRRVARLVSPLGPIPEVSRS
ncbi:MAG: class II glutamine amidotransferase [Elusimicrobiota bacterium]|nr:class II glutamine amidotransferase [Elusimicrobiota bacterium]